MSSSPEVNDSPFRFDIFRKVQTFLPQSSGDVFQQLDQVDYYVPIELTLMI